MKPNKKMQVVDACLAELSDLNERLRAMATDGATPRTVINGDESAVQRIRSILPPPPRPTVLVVDDERANLQAFALQFEDRFNIMTANNGAEALELLGRHPVDVLLTDHLMPGMTGVELCRIVAKRWPRVRRIIFSAFVSEDKVADAGAESFFSKPWDEERLAAAILGRSLAARA